ncbi:hypothetical protein PI125_g15987, partial [Phytophthora idaei]
LEPQVTPIYSDDLGDEGFGTAHLFRRHQQRALFNASQLSPLIKQYFRSPTKNAKKASFVLRTIPSADCAVGGEETFHKFYRQKAQKGYAAEAQRQHEKCIREIQKEQRDTKREIAALHETRDLVLSSGKKALQAGHSLPRLDRQDFFDVPHARWRCCVSMLAILVECLGSTPARCQQHRDLDPLVH